MAAPVRIAGSLGGSPISAVWWGAWVAAVSFGLLLILLGADLLPATASLLSSPAPLYLLHRLTCWVIDGFTSN